MVIDTSAIVAIALDEPEAVKFERVIVESPIRLMSVATLIEATMVIETRLGPDGGHELDLWIHKAGVVLVDVDHEQADIARRAWRRWGKGHHPAALNYGDCLSYALAVQRGEPLLFKGNDFSRTDVRVACGLPTTGDVLPR